MADELLIDADGVSKSFGHAEVVHDMRLTVAPGEIVGLLGANGAGKTTLIRMLLGLENPSSGTVHVFGQPPSRRSRSRIGYMAQGLGLYAELSVRENLAFVSAAFHLPAPELPPALAAVATRPVRSIGLGLQRQLAFLCALSHAPELLVLDEPTSGVDPLARARLWDVIHEQAERGVGVLVTTHYLQEAEQCGRLEIMSAGHGIASGSVDSITAGVSAVLVESDRWEGAFTALVDAGLPVSLAGRSSRVAGADADAVRQALAHAHVDARVTAVPSTLEETMVLLDREKVANTP